ncbi:ABC transporter ATP-binding protein, partial [Campylobacter jejuni]
MIKIDINHPINTTKGRLDLNFKKDIESGKITAL